MGPYSKDGVVGRVQNKMDTGDSYRLDLFIPKNKYTEHFPSCNLADVLKNAFSDLLHILMDFRSFPVFFISSFHLAAFDRTSSCKPLDFTSPSSSATCNSGNILAFYH